MTWDRVPHFTGGGAPNSAASMRTAQYAASGGARGVVEPGDLKVSALPAPGPQVRVGTGGALIPSKYPGDTQQTYSPRNPTIDTVGISATGSGGGRSDLVYVSIEDPYASGSTFPEPENPLDPAVRFVFTRVVPNVSPTVTRLHDVPGYENVTGYELARIDIPASTAAITNAMIVDLRRTANDASLIFPKTWQGPASGNQNAATTLIRWPDNIQQVDLPESATYLEFTAILTVLHLGGNADGEIQAFMDGAAIGGIKIIDLDAGTNGTRPTLLVTGGGVIPPAKRGARVSFELRARVLNASSAPGRIYFDMQSSLKFEVAVDRRAV